MAELQRPDMVIFDWDNTLVDTWPVIHDALDGTFRYMGKGGWSLEDTLGKVRKSLRESFPEHFGDRWEEARDKFYEIFEARHLDKLVALDGAGALLKCLSGMDIKAAVVSNKRGDLVRKESGHLSFDPFFLTVLGATDAKQDKPHPMVIDLALKDSGLKPGPHIWFVGDTAIDIECARNAGLSAIAVAPADKREVEFASFPPDLFCDDLDHLTRVISAL